MNFIKDLFTLDVITITGEIKIKSKDTEEGDRKKSRDLIDFDEMFDKIKGKSTTDLKLKVLAATRIEIDRDTTHFVSSDLTDAEVPLVQMHFEAVSAATEGRSGVIARYMPQGRRGGEGGGNA